MHDLTIGGELGGTKSAAILLDGAGNILNEFRCPTEAERGREAVLENIVAAARAVAGEDFGRVAAVGLGAPGPLNRREGLIYQAPNLGWQNVPIVRLLQEKLGRPVFLENDANAAGFGEWALGAGRGTKDMIYLTVSTGIGGGLILGGRIHHGRDDSAGEVGHTIVLPDGPLCGCGRRGCWEALASGTAIARAAAEALKGGRESRIRELAGGDPAAVDAAMVARAAREGDALAREVLDRAFYYLALGIVNLIHLLNPEAVVICGGVSKMCDELFIPVRRMVAEWAYAAMVRDLPIVPAALGDRAGVIGAAMVARAILRD
ncbi:MAG: ROK family protein [Firmicutes bacterium]|nr:ROK family protein [Bacillota bacterium]